MGGSVVSTTRRGESHQAYLHKRLSGLSNLITPGPFWIGIRDRVDGVSESSKNFAGDEVSARASAVRSGGGTSGLRRFRVVGETLAGRRNVASRLEVGVDTSRVVFCSSRQRVAGRVSLLAMIAARAHATLWRGARRVEVAFDALGFHFAAFEVIEGSAFFVQLFARHFFLHAFQDPVAEDVLDNAGKLSTLAHRLGKLCREGAGKVAGLNVRKVACLADLLNGCGHRLGLF